MNAGLTLYGLSRDGGASIERAGDCVKSMTPAQAKRLGDEDGVVWVPVCTMDEALAARDMAEALRIYQDAYSMSDVVTAREVGADALKKAGHA